MQGNNKQYGDESLLPEMHILLCQFSQIIQESPKFDTNLFLSHMGQQISWIKRLLYLGIWWLFSQVINTMQILKGNKALAKPAR